MNSSSVADSRESARHYIPASKSDISEMLQAVGHASFEDLFAHIDPDVLFAETPDLPEELNPEALRARLQEIAEHNRIVCFPEMVCSISRRLKWLVTVRHSQPHYGLHSLPARA